MLKAAIVGCGDIAGGYDEKSTSPEGIFTHAGAYRACNVEIAAVFDTDLSRAKSFSKHWGVTKLCESIEELYLADEYDLVSICVPDHLHYDVAKNFLLRGKTRILWIEKPITLSSSQGKRLVDLAHEADTGIRVTYQRRWDPMHNLLAKQIEEGMIGDVTAVHGYYVKGLMHIGTTMIDTIRMFIGEPISAFSISRETKGSYYNDSSTDLTLVYSNGITASIQGVDAKSYTFSIFEIDIIGTNGRVRILDNGNRYEIYNLVSYGHYQGFFELRKRKSGRTKMDVSMRIGVEKMITSLDDSTWRSVSDGHSAIRNIELAEMGRK